MTACSEEHQDIEMPRDDGLMEEFDNKSFYHYFNDNFKEENVKMRKKPPANSGFDSRAGTSLQNEIKHCGKNICLVIIFKIRSSKFIFINRFKNLNE